MSPKPSRNALCLAAIAACLLTSSARAGNLLTNGGFDTPTPGLTPPNYPTSISGASTFGNASAEDWTLFNSRDATTSTELLPTTDPTGSLPYMIHLTSVSNTSDPTDSFFNGLQQGFATQSTLTTATVDVDVLSGPVILALYAGDGATLINYTLSSTTDTWSPISVSAPAGTDPNLFVLYSYSTTGTGEFYADNASVTAAAVPEPASGVLALIGMSATAFWVRKAGPRLRARRVGPSN
jgi:hypothetical protein